jgi:predicted small lipoprotein YifL
VSKTLIVPILMAMALILTGCGVKGDLYLPAKKSSSGQAAQDPVSSTKVVPPTQQPQPNQ